MNNDLLLALLTSLLTGTSCLSGGCTGAALGGQDLETRVGTLQAQVEAAREAGVEVDAVITVGPGHAGFPNAAWDTGISGTIHMSADPGAVNERDLLEHAQFLVDKLLQINDQGGDPGVFSTRPDGLERVLNAARATAEARRASQPAPPEANPDPVSETDSGT